MQINNLTLCISYCKKNKKLPMKFSMLRSMDKTNSSTSLVNFDKSAWTVISNSNILSPIYKKSILKKLHLI